MKRRLVLFACALLVVPAALAAPRRPEAWTFDAVLAYLREASGGLIDRAPDAPASHDRLRYYRALDPPDRFVPVSPRDPRLDQDAYTFDVDGFVRQQGATDFVDAKRRYFRSLPWIRRDQVHDVPYARPTAWQTLNHPPIKRLDGPRERWTDLFAGEPPDRAGGDPGPFFDPAFQVDLDAQTGTELTHQNRLELLANGEAWTEKLRLVARSRRRLWVAVMFWACDASSDLLADAMFQKVREGVDVRLLTEGLYRETITRKCIDRLVAGGVKVVSARDALRPRSFAAVMHWKVWIRDGEEMVLGGENILDYENHSDGFNLLNRDTDVLVEGPAVTDAEKAFIVAWDRERPPDPLAPMAGEVEARLVAQRAAGVRGSEHYATWLGDPATRMAGNCRVAMQTTNAASQPIGPLVQAHYEASRSQVVFSSPTLRYDPSAPENARNEGLMVHRLMRGLFEGPPPGEPPRRKVLVLTNGIGGAIGESSMWLRYRNEGAWKARQWFLYRVARQFGDLVGRRASIANRRVTAPLGLNPEVEVWTYFQYIHSKLWLFDRTASFVGSWNVEYNSTELNPEAAILCLDARLRDELEVDLATALVNSVPEASAGVR